MVTALFSGAGRTMMNTSTLDGMTMILGLTRLVDGLFLMQTNLIPNWRFYYGK